MSLDDAALLHLRQLVQDRTMELCADDRGGDLRRLANAVVVDSFKTPMGAPGTERLIAFALVARDAGLLDAGLATTEPKARASAEEAGT